ncbi:MAG: hypothetical protein QW315_06700 [Candidatus Hadarchaeum sp.]
MLRLITSRNEIQKCQKEFENRLKKLLPKKERLDIGFQGGKITNDVFYSGNLWYSTMILQHADIPRYWNAFGLEKRKDGNQIIVVEINPPVEGSTKQVAGLFAKDEITNDLFILHRGKIGGGRKGIGKEKFKNWYRGKWVQVFDDQGNDEEAILISSISSNYLLPKLTEFVREVAKFKESVADKHDNRTIDDVETSLSFRPEFHGKKKGKRRSIFEYDSYHGLIVNALEIWISKRLKQNQKTYNNSLIDLAIIDGERIIGVYEVKTRSDSQSVYTGIGQLMFHSGGDDKISRYLVLPDDHYDKRFLSILSALKINLIKYERKGSEIKFIA